MNDYVIDINADVGEGIGNEHQLMPYISSCNIACGGHAGDHKSMQEVVKLAKTYGVKIGAHPSFPDPINFGRKPLEISYAALFTSIEEQIEALMDILQIELADLHHVKLHGALYNLAAVDEKIAMVIVEAMKAIAAPVKLYVPYNSIISNMALENNIPIVYEAFADRNYNDDLTLVNRKENNAIIEDIEALFEHVYRMIAKSSVKTINGNIIPIKAETFCIHGDNLNAIRLVRELHQRLQNQGIEIN